ncbi:MAG: 1,2-phenylacetyl-CoA epoxidase subunit PaaC [Casimicrobium sp.]
MPNTLSEKTLLTLADSCLLWGHRLSEWCGHGPALEEDIALTNTALDVIGQARALLQRVASRRTPATTEDALAYFRDSHEFHNVTLAELPNGDYAQTILRSLLLAAWFVPVWEALEQHTDRDVATIAANAAKEARMQLRHAHDWVVRFGDGTPESRQRIEAAVAALWPYCDEMLNVEIDGTASDARRTAWSNVVASVFYEATLMVPLTGAFPAANTEHADRVALLAEMQSLARQHPNAVW